MFSLFVQVLKIFFIQKEAFGRILSMLFQWFVTVSYLPADASGELISKFRTQVVIIN